MENWILFFVAATVIITPLIACPLKLFDGYILPQIGAGAIGIGLTILFWIWNGAFPFNFISIVAFLYFIYLMISCSWSTAPQNSLRDVPLIFLSIFSFLICSTLFENKSNMVGISLAVFCISMFTALYSIGQRFRFDPLFPERLRSRAEEFKSVPPEEVHEAWKNEKFIDSRAIGTVGNTNFNAGFLLSTIPFLMYLSFEISRWFLLSVMVIIFAIICTKSRAGKLSVGVFILVFILFLSGRGLVFDALFRLTANVSPLEVFITNLLFILIGMDFYIKMRDKNPLKFLSNKEDNFNTMLDWENDNQSHWAATLRYRSKYWKIAIALIRKRLLHGYGLRTYRREVYFEQALINQKDSKFLRPGYYQTPQPRECHNDFLENFVEGGLIGGLMFLTIIFVIFYNSINLIETLAVREYIMVCGVMAAIIGVMVEVFFFFPLRLGAPALLFWISLALLQSFSGIDLIILPTNNIFLILFIAGALAAMIWEGVIKPNIGNYLFTKHSFSAIIEKKERYLRKAIRYCPKESIFRTHMLIGYLEGFPMEADFNAEMLRHHYDGMMPAWASAYNCGAVKLKKLQFAEAARFFSEALFFLPSFDVARQQLERILPLVPFERRGNIMKQMTGEGVNAVRHFQSEVRRLQESIQKSEGTFINIVLTEKIKMNIPLDWVFDPDTCQFFNMSELPPGSQVIELGPTKLPLLVKQAVPVAQ